MVRRTNRSTDPTGNEAARQAKTDAFQEQAESKTPRSTLDQLNQIDTEDIEDEIGLEEVDIDSEDLNEIVADDADEEEDEDGIEDGAEGGINDEEIISDLPPDMTQSYGTGLQGQPTDRSGRRAHEHQDRYFHEADAVLTGGDIDANYEQADAVGDEAVGGTVATPDQDVVDELGAAVGLDVDDRSFLRTNETLEERDDRRWELDPKSSEDYQERRD